MTNLISIVGTVATVPRLITTQSGVPLCSFRVASGERKFDREKNSWVDGDTNWFTVTSFRGLATHAHESFQKGDRVIVNGRLRVRQWERDDRSGTSVDIEADAIGHDLRWGTTQFTKNSRPDDGQTDEGSERAEPQRWAAPHDSTPQSAGTEETADDATTAGPERGSSEPRSDGFLPAAA